MHYHCKNIRDIFVFQNVIRPIYVAPTRLYELSFIHKRQSASSGLQPASMKVFEVSSDSSVQLLGVGYI